MLRRHREALKTAILPRMPLASRALPRHRTHSSDAGADVGRSGPGALGGGVLLSRGDAPASLAHAVVAAEVGPVAAHTPWEDVTHVLDGRVRSARSKAGNTLTSSAVKLDAVLTRLMQTQHEFRWQWVHRCAAVIAALRAQDERHQVRVRGLASGTRAVDGPWRA